MYLLIISNYIKMLALKKKYHYFNVPKHLIFSFQFYIFKFQNFHISIQINIFSILLRSFHNKSSLIVKQLKNKLLNSIQFYLQSITKSREFSVSVFFCFSQFFFFFTSTQQTRYFGNWSMKQPEEPGLWIMEGSIFARIIRLSWLINLSHGK